MTPTVLSLPRRPRRAPRTWTALLTFAVVGASLVAPVWAQTTSTLQGTVADAQRLTVSEAEIRVVNTATGAKWATKTDASGFYRVAALPAGTYAVTVTRSGFATRTYDNLEVPLNRTAVLDIVLEVGALEQVVTVEATLPLLETTTATIGTTILPEQILEMPLNGRNYLDLMQLVPGVAFNRRVDEGSDVATPVLGERAGNTIYLVDGMPNRDEFGGGAGAQFNQDTIQEFEVLTTGFKAEFGHGSGGVVNVITKSGTNSWTGSGFLFHRNSEVDRTNSLDTAQQEAPFLRRWDVGATFGGPIARDRVFLFGSAERLRESRQLNFAVPPGTPQVVRDLENDFNERTRTVDTRLFAKIDEQVGRHRLTQQVNFTDGNVSDYLPLTAATSFPSTRRSLDDRTTFVGARDTALLGNPTNPFLFTAYAQYRGEPAKNSPAHPEAGSQIRWFVFTGLNTGTITGDRGLFQLGTGDTVGEIDPKYGSAGANLAKAIGRHDFKFGLDFMRTHVDGNEAQSLDTQLFATEENFGRFGFPFAGFFTTTTTGGVNPEDNRLGLRNDYLGLYAQNDWRIRDNLTLNLGLRWDYDSRFVSKENVSPRIGVAWTPTQRTVVRGSWGLFYDRFRLGLARRVPEFGGSRFVRTQPASYPQLFYNLTSSVPVLFGICADPFRTSSQIAAGTPCPANPGLPLLGVNHLNDLGPRPIPPETVVTRDNVQSLSGLTPDQFLEAANRAAALPGSSRWFWGPFGALSHPFLGGPQPISLDPAFETPFSRVLTLGVQRELSTNILVVVDYVHKDIKNILGVRNTNIAFEARLPGRSGTFLPPVTSTFVHGFGPWYEGDFDALIVSVVKRLSHRFSLTTSYTWTNAMDNLLNAGLGSGTGIFSFPTDSFVGVPPVVTAAGGQTNANGSFVASNGNHVPQAGQLYNGADMDRGKSDLAFDHTLLVHGVLAAPGGFQVSGIFRAQSGFRFSRQAERVADPDGNGAFSVRDLSIPRNDFTGPPFVNMDLRVSKQIPVRDRRSLTLLVEFFNLFNRQNPAAVESARGRPTAFGAPLQVLPGMETQVGLRVEF